MGRTACTEPHCLYRGALYLTFYMSLEMLNIYAQNTACMISRKNKRHFETELTLRLLMSYIYIYVYIHIYVYGAPILDVSRSHTTTHHSR